MTARYGPVMVAGWAVGMGTQEFGSEFGPLEKTDLEVPLGIYREARGDWILLGDEWGFAEQRLLDGE